MSGQSPALQAWYALLVIRLISAFTLSLNFLVVIGFCLSV